MLRVAGPPSLTTATRRSFLASAPGSGAGVVPSRRGVIGCGSARGALSTVSMAAMMPPVMSGVHGTLALAITRSAGSMMTASVLVPPTSMPRRQSGAGTGELLDRQVLEVVTEGPPPGDLDPRLGPPAAAPATAIPASVRQTGSQGKAITVTRCP